MTIVTRIRNFFRHLIQHEEGQGLAEYGLILALIAVVAVAGLTALGLAITGRLSGIASSIGG